MVKRRKYDNMVIGIVVGLLAPFLGFVLYGWGWAAYYHNSFSYFVNRVFLGMSQMQSPIVSLSLLINLIPFFLFLRFKRYRSAQGVVAALFIYVPLVLYLKFR